MTLDVHDLRRIVRGLGHRKAFAATAVLSLALGIGAACALFSVVDAVLLKPLPIPEADRLVVLAESRNGDPIGGSPQRVLDYAQRLSDLEATTGYYGEDLVLTGRGEPEGVRTLRAFGPFFRVLGISPALGRGFTPEEERGGGPGVIVLSRAFFERRFGGDPSVVGQTLRLGNGTMTVIGVLPRLEYPDHIDAIATADQRAEATPRQASFLYTLARVGPEASVKQVQAQADALVEVLAREHPESDQGLTVRVLRMWDEETREARLPLFMLLGASGLLLLVVCVNVGGLVLARQEEQRHEAAVRGALGASVSALRVLFLAESLLLAALGAGLGLALAGAGIELLKQLLPAGFPRLAAATLDGRVAAFAALLALVGGLATGLAPARAATRGADTAALRVGRAVTPDRGRVRMRSALVVAEVALAVVLVAGTTLLSRAFLELRARPLGFEPAGVLTLDVAFPWDTPKERLDAFTRDATTALATLPGVRRVGVADRLPFEGDTQGRRIGIPGRDMPKGLEGRSISFRAVTADYFAALAVPLLEGRLFADRADRREVVVNETFARRLFPGESPLDQAIVFDAKDPERSTFRIVGVVGDLRMRLTDRRAEPETFVSRTHTYWPLLIFAVQGTGDPLALAPAARAAMARVDPRQIVRRLEPLPARLRGAEMEPRIRTLLLGGFSAAALFLSAIGLFGLLAQDVAQRRREIAIRMALGAGPGRVRQAVVRRALALATLGLGMGGLLAVQGGKLLRGLLYGIEPADPAALLVTALVLLAVVVLASFVPARRATSVDPMTALRSE